MQLKNLELYEYNYQSTMEIIRLISLLVPSILLAYPLASISTASATEPFFLFGDSFLDAGNNNYINTSTVALANLYPYGITFFHYPTGRCSDGRLVCDFIGIALYYKVHDELGLSGSNHWLVYYFAMI